MQLEFFTQPQVKARKTPTQCTHKGMRGEIIKYIEEFKNTHQRLPELVKRHGMCGRGDREGILAINKENLKQWKLNSQRATYSWALKSKDFTVKTINI